MRVAVVLSGCGHLDGSEIREAVLTMLAIERADFDMVIAAPDLPTPGAVDHRTGHRDGVSRSSLVEASRIARGVIIDLANLQVDDFDMLIFPGGFGVGQILSNYAEKGATCDVLPDVTRLLRGALAAKKPMGFVCLAPVLAARVLGPLTGLRLTLGAKGTAPAKHAAVMGADVRATLVGEVIVDDRVRVVSTPAYMYDDARLPDVERAIEKALRSMMNMLPRATTATAQPAPTPARAEPSAPRPTPAAAPFRRRPR